MQQKNSQPGNFRKGFSLIELLVVIAIIGLLSSVVTIVLGGVRAKAVTAAGQIFEGNLYQNYASDALAIWNFDEGPGSADANRIAFDSSGNHNDLILDPTAFSGDWPAPWASSSQAFRGNSALVLANGSAETPGSTTIAAFDPANGSLSFWINMRQAINSGIFCNNNGNVHDLSPYAQFCIFDSGAAGKFISADWNGGGLPNRLETNIDPSAVLNTWTQVAVSWNILPGSSKGTMQIYVNGKEAASSSNYVLPTRLAYPYSFCVGGDCYGDNLMGSIDEMRVYSHSLQVGDAEKLYAEGLGHHRVADILLPKKGEFF